MSKHLVKILSLCALVVLMAVSIVGAAVCVTEAVGCTLTVVDASKDAEFAESGVAIYIDGKKQEESTIRVSKYTEVEVKYEGVQTGYNFNGWYVGNYDINKDKAVSDKTTYKFEVKRNTKITAVSELKKYNVTFIGTNADGSNVNIGSNMEFEFGAPLPTLEHSTDKYFYGWNIVSDSETQDATIYNNAIFDVEDTTVTLTPNWGSQQFQTYTINVAYKPGSDIIDQVTYNTRDQEFVYARTRANYTIVGINFKGQVYSYSEAEGKFIGLGEAIARDGGETTDATAVWACKYGSFTFNIAGVAYYYDESANESTYWSVYGDRDGKKTEILEEGVYAIFRDGQDEDEYDLTDNMYDIFIAQRYSNIRTFEEEPLTFANQIRISVGGSYTEEYNLSGPSVSFAHVLTFLEEPGQYGTLTGNEIITIEFVYEL